MRVPRRLLAVALLGLFASAVPGCGDKVYNGSESFSERHPEYNDTQPSYMNRSSDDDPHPGRPW